MNKNPQIENPTLTETVIEIFDEKNQSSLNQCFATSENYNYRTFTYIQKSMAVSSSTAMPWEL